MDVYTNYKQIRAGSLVFCDRAAFTQSESSSFSEYTSPVWVSVCVVFCDSEALAFVSWKMYWLPHLKCSSIWFRSLHAFLVRELNQFRSMCFEATQFAHVQAPDAILCQHHLGVRMHSVSYSRMVSIGICSVIVQKSSVLFRRQLSRGKEENQRFLFLLNS